MFNDGVLFRTKRFVPDYRYTCNFVDLDYSDELVLLDISRDGDRKDFYAVLDKFADSPLPITVGGGITTLTEAVMLMRNFAVDMFVIGRAAIDRQFIGKLAEKFGSQAIIVSIDVGENGNAHIEHGTKDTGYPAMAYAQMAVAAGAGGITLQSIDRDGSLRGYDIDILRNLCDSLPVPVVTGNGCGGWHHMVSGFEAGASGCALTNIFHHTAESLKAARAACLDAGLPMRTLL
jgi:cyclase